MLEVAYYYIKEHYESVSYTVQQFSIPKYHCHWQSTWKGYITYTIWTVHQA